jgi:hypothetical protein
MESWREARLDGKTWGEGRGQEERVGRTANGLEGRRNQSLMFATSLIAGGSGAKSALCLEIQNGKDAQER